MVNIVVIPHEQISNCWTLFYEIKCDKHLKICFIVVFKSSMPISLDQKDLYTYLFDLMFAHFELETDYVLCSLGL